MPFCLTRQDARFFFVSPPLDLTSLSLSRRPSSATRLPPPPSQAIDRAFIADPDRSSAAWPRANPAALDAAIAAHLARTGRPGALAALVAEAGLDPSLPATLAAPFLPIQPALAALAVGDAAPARAWAAAHRDALVAERGLAGADAFEFALVRAAFLDALAAAPANGGGPAAALAITRAEFGRFARTQLADIQALMGRLVYAAAGGGAGGATPARYPPLDTAGLWAAAGADLVRAAAYLGGLPSESPLVVALAAGACALPTLHKLSIANARMGGGGGAGGGGGGGGAGGARPGDSGEGTAAATSPAASAASPADPDDNAIPVDLDLGPEFVFRSVFSCPVSREAASEANPPVLLPCGHALCRASVLSIAHGPARAFKCPYCPAEAMPGSCRPLRFPDAAAARRGGGGGGGG